MKKTKLAIIALSAVTILNTSVYAKTFSDVTKNGQFKWIYSELDNLSNRGIFGGYPEGDFRPNNPVSFLEIMQVIKNIKQPSDFEMQEANRNYLEIARSNNVPNWALDAVVYSLSNNTISEKTLSEANSRGFLKETNPIYPNRNSVSVYFGRAFGFSGNGDKSLLKHTDLEDVPEVTLGYLSDLVKNDIFSATGSEGKFNGKNFIRRAEVVSIASKSLKFLGKEEINTESENTGTLINEELSIKNKVEYVDKLNNLIRLNGVDYKFNSETKLIGIDINNIDKLLGKEVEILQENNIISSLTLKEELIIEKYNAKLVGRIIDSRAEDGMNKLSIRILVSNNKELVSGSDVEIKTVQNFNLGDIITFDAKIENGYVIEVNVQR